MYLRRGEVRDDRRGEAVCICTAEYTVAGSVRAAGCSGALAVLAFSRSLCRGRHRDHCGTAPVARR